MTDQEHFNSIKEKAEALNDAIADAAKAGLVCHFGIRDGQTTMIADKDLRVARVYRSA